MTRTNTEPFGKEKETLIGLIPFATEVQKEYLNKILEFGSANAAAKSLGVNESTVRTSIHRLKAAAARKGYSPEHDMTSPVPDGYLFKGQSVLRDAEGNVKLKWEKSSIDYDRQLEMMRRMAELFAEENITPRKLSVCEEAHKGFDYYDIIPWLQIGDAHLGMLACAKEVGHDYDIKIASRELLTAFEFLIDQMPTTERIVIHDTGDMTHYENIAGVTDHSGHMLDYDTRYFKMIDVYYIVMKSLLDMAAKKFKYIDLIIDQGNHSQTNDMCMASALRHLYSLDGRLNVLDNSSVFIPYRMGNTFVLTHHGHKCKPEKLVDVMSIDYAQDWGESTYRYIDTAHVHHGNKTVKENHGVIFESFNNMTPADKYAHEGGWRSRGTMTTVLRSRTYGEVGRRTLPREQVLDMLKNATPGDAAKNNRREVYTV